MVEINALKVKFDEKEDWLCLEKGRRNNFKRNIIFVHY